MHDVERFSRWAGGYDRARFQRHIARIHDAMLATVADDPSSPTEILDVGCGTGRFLGKAGRRWPSARLVGVDPAEGMIAVARRLAPDVSFHIAPAESLPVAPSSIDLAFSAISLHHWANQLRGLREVAQALRPGGLVCLADIAVPRWIAKVLHSRAQNAEGIRRLVAQAGLELEGERHILAHVIFIVVARRPRDREPRDGRRPTSR